MTGTSAQPVRRWLFVATILLGSFLLFLIQPMVARMALPRLGGAPNVWNSAMVVYQLLLLGGYAYSHVLSGLSFRRQATVHLGLLLLAAATLPIALADFPPPVPGWEVLWVPLLLAATVGPVFFAVSAQAPLMQRWYFAHPGAGEPWALYAASNLGSLAGLLAYPLLAEPQLPIAGQSLAWGIGYGLLLLLVVLAAWGRWRVGGDLSVRSERVPVELTSRPPQLAQDEAIGTGRILLWLTLSAVPSGLMLSTTTHLTTDIFAMPLLWVIPLGLYLLSFVFAFADRQIFARGITNVAPAVMLLAGGFAMVSRDPGTLVLALGSVLLLFVVAVALHGRLYDLRPHASQLTKFYFVMSAGGALGGVFTAIIAPAAFDWVWEHPLLVLAAALFMPLSRVYDWRRLPGLDPAMARLGAFVLLAVAIFLAFHLLDVAGREEPGQPRLYLTIAMTVLGLLLAPWRWMFLAVLAMLMLAQGGLKTLDMSFDGVRSRSYFGVYTVHDYPSLRLRLLTHGTTLHGQQSTDPAHAREPMTYYGPNSGIAVALSRAQAFYGKNARIGVVGLGTGTLACYREPGERWTFYEIDPVVLRLSRERTFTYLADCAPDAAVALGDARLELAKARPASFDILVVDAFSSDAIPLHLLTDEAFGVYLRALAPRGLLVVHISNRYIELEPVLAAAARKRGLVAAVRNDNPWDRTRLTPSSWVVLTHDPLRLKELAAARPDAPWEKLQPPAPRAWTDGHASVLPYIRWRHLLRKP